MAQALPHNRLPGLQLQGPASSPQACHVPGPHCQAPPHASLHRPHLLQQPRQGSASLAPSPWKPWRGSLAAFGLLTGFH